MQIVEFIMSGIDDKGSQYSTTYPVTHRSTRCGRSNSIAKNQTPKSSSQLDPNKNGIAMQINIGQYITLNTEFRGDL